MAEYVLSVADANRDEQRFVRRESRVRGMLLGLALGDAWTSNRHPRRGSATTQLACVVTEGLIRAMVRQSHRGICRESSVIWHAHLRWARQQGIDVRYEWQPDGWLVGVTALGQRRGDAPATVAALRAHSGAGLSPSLASGTSRGHHALTRLVALAAVASGQQRDHAGLVAQECAAATHAHPEIAGVVADGIVALATALDAPDVEGWRARLEALDDSEVRRAVSTGAVTTAPPLTARAALESALVVALRHAERSAVAEALEDASTGPAASGSTPLVGAFLGARLGIEALPGAVWDLELGHVVDTLSRDLVTEADRSRSGGEYQQATDPRWWERYPGW